MKTVMDIQDALEKIYSAGTLCRFGNICFEGIGNRSTNWGIGTTISIVGPIQNYSRKCLNWFLDSIDSENFQQNYRKTSVKLTTLLQSEKFCQSLGLLNLFEENIEAIKEHDLIVGVYEIRKTEGGRVANKSQTICIKKDFITKETDVFNYVSNQLKSFASQKQLKEAFHLGFTGLTPMIEDFQKIIFIPPEKEIVSSPNINVLQVLS